MRREPARDAPRELVLEPEEGEPEKGSSEGLPEWFKGHLARGASAAKPGSEARDAWRDRTVGPPRDLEEGANALGPFAARRTRFDTAAPHGQFRLREVDDADRDAFCFFTGDEQLAALDPRSAVYLDIETTGLSGGAGTVPFMVCLGSFDGESFELWQGFLREPDEEPALLAEIAERIAASSGVVSFFGKSFDRHRLEDKMRMHGVQPPFAERPHLDLFHPCRRLYRAALPDARLQTMERALCGVVRSDDLPGAYAPAAWYDYLAERAHLLEHVFTHNLIDVLSLVTLYAHLGRALVEQRGTGEALDGDGIPTAAARAAALAKLHLQRRSFEPGVTWCERAIERLHEVSADRTPDGMFVRDLQLMRAECLARAERCDEALEAYRSLGAHRDALAARALFEASRLEGDLVAHGLLERAATVARVTDLRLLDKIERRLRSVSRRLAR
jgi:uncharacterized protein YprB with RNaseH-like and TPR domain